MSRRPASDTSMDGPKGAGHAGDDAGDSAPGPALSSSLGRVPQQAAVLLFASLDAGMTAADTWLAARGLEATRVVALDDLQQRALRGRPRLVVFDARESTLALEACRWLKGDSYTGIVPGVVIAADRMDAFVAAFAAGADEVLRPSMPAEEVWIRLDAVLRRSDRDTSVHPSTRLPGTFAIEAEIARRLAAGQRFGVCYADLDHFKEFNDRYGYYQGDRVIRMLAMILHDVVKGMCGDDGFVGHIGGDDFIFLVPLDAVGTTCREIISVFDSFVPLQYSEQDRRAGYFFGKDRRGQLHRVPLMTLSIGVATNARRSFAHAAQVSDLATEMKTYAKTQPGSVYFIDRRGVVPSAPAEGEAPLPEHATPVSVETLGGDR
jgi:diguanylate cyclase (GGDEF)-like protein